MKIFLENLRDRVNINFKAAVTPVNAPLNNFAVFVPKFFQSAAMTLTAQNKFYVVALFSNNAEIFYSEKVSAVENLRDRFNINFKTAITPVNVPLNNFEVFVPKFFQSAAMTFTAQNKARRR